MIDLNTLKHEQLMEYEVFKGQGPFAGCMIPQGYQLIRVHTIFNVKVDGRHKSRVVAHGYLTTTPTKLVYSGVAWIVRQKDHTHPLFGYKYHTWLLYYLEKSWLVYVPFTTRLLLTGIASSNLYLKQLHMAQNFCPERKFVRTSLTIKHTFNPFESQLMIWTMYREIMRVWSIAQQYLKPSCMRDTISYCFTMLEV